MKIKYNSSIIYNITLFMIMVSCGLFCIISMPILRSAAMQYSIVFVISVGLFFNSIINKKIKNATKAYTTYFYIFLFYLAIFLFIHCLYGVIKYDQGIRSIYGAAKYFAYFLMFVPFIYILESNNGYETLLKDISIIMLIVTAFKALKALVYNIAGISILNWFESSIRYGRTRIMLMGFGALSFIYFTNKLLNSSPKKRNFYGYLAADLFLIFYILYIDMTRMDIIGYAAAFTVMLIAKKRPKNKQIVSVILIIIVAALILSSGMFENFVESFSRESDELGLSSVVRDLARDYFRQFPKSNMLLGLGFLNPDTAARTAVFFGKDGVYCLDDLGIANMYYHYGILGIILAVLVLGRMLFCAVNIILSNSKNKLIIIGITVLIASTQASLCIFDGQRMLNLVLYWAIFEYEYAQIKKAKPKFKVKKLAKPKITITT